MEAFERINIGNGHWVVRNLLGRHLQEEEEAKEGEECRITKINFYLVHTCTTLWNFSKALGIPFPLLPLLQIPQIHMTG